LGPERVRNCRVHERDFFFLAMLFSISKSCKDCEKSKDWWLRHGELRRWEWVWVCVGAGTGMVAPLL
jgi:hypothetical protein